MKRWVFLALALTACGLEIVGTKSAPVTTSDGGAPPPELEMPPPGPTDAGAPQSDAGDGGFCDDPTLLLCMPFEGTVTDDSRHKQPASVVGPLTFVAGVSGQAVHLTKDTVIQLPNDAIYAVDDLTIEAWVRLSSLPDGGRYGIVDNNQSFGVFVYADGTLRSGASTNVDAGVVAAQKWTHLGCSGGKNGKIDVYVDGVRVGGLTSDAGVSAPGADPIAIGGNSPSGERMLGDLDGLRIYARRKTAAEIAADAKQ